MKKSFVTALAVALLGAMTLGAVASSASAPHKPAKNIVQTAVAAGSFKTLVSLVKQAGLAGALSGPGPLTVFAPTDAAFAKVPKATLAALAKDKSKLKAVLLYHVAKGKLTAAKVVKLHSVKTLNGQSLKIRVSHGTVNGRRRARHQDRHRRLKRRDPRDQQGADPAVTLPTSSGRRRCGALTGAALTDRGRPYGKATMTALTLPHPPAGERLRGRRHPVRRVVSLVPVSPILRQTGTERPRCGRSASVASSPV